MPTLQRIDHIHVFVSDRAAAEIWYAKVLGLKRIRALESWGQGGGPLTLEDSSGSVHIALFERPRLACRSTIAFAASASEFMGWKEHLEQALASPLAIEDHELSWSMYFADPDGNPYEITSHEYAALAPLLGGAGD